MLTRILHRPSSAQGRAQLAETRTEESNYRALLANGALFGPIDGGIFNYLPVFLARLDASPSLVSLVTAGPSLVGIFAYLPGGAYAERHADLVRLVARTSVLLRLSYLAIALLPLFLAPSHIPLAAVLLWSLNSTLNGFYIPAWTTVMQKAISPERRAQFIGARWALYSLVTALAIAVFGFMLDRMPFPLGYQIVFLCSLAAGLASAWFFSKVRVTPFVAQAQDGVGERAIGARLRSFVQPLAESREFVRYNLATLLYRLVYNMPIALYSIFWVNDLRASDTWIGLRGMAGYTALVIGYRFWGRMANRMGHRTLLIVCGAFVALYPISTALAPSVEWLLPAAVLWGVATSGVDIGLFDMLLAACPEGRQPRFSAVANMLVSVAASVGPLLGAALAQGVSIRVALLVSGGLQVLTCALFLLLPSREQEGLVG